MSTTERKHTILSISHGAGPLPILGDEGHKEMVENLELLATRIAKPTAVIIISAHWEEPAPTVLNGPQPPLLYDYYGFPEESYEITYPAMGNPELATAVQGALSEHGIECRPEGERGFDHGMFIPLKIMYPEADIPCVQISLIQGLDPASHIAMGKALSTVDYENLLILGSGFTFHNMQAFFRPETPETRSWNEAFEQWLIETCSDSSLSEAERTSRLTQWESAPHARYCHPREEHLLPLLVCCGAAGRPCSEHHELMIFGKKGSTYLWT